MNSNFSFSVPLCIGTHLVSGRLLPLQGRLIVGLIMRLFFVKYEMRLYLFTSPLLFRIIWCFFLPLPPGLPHHCPYHPLAFPLLFLIIWCFVLPLSPRLPHHRPYHPPLSSPLLLLPFSSSSSSSSSSPFSPLVFLPCSFPSQYALPSYMSFGPQRIRDLDLSWLTAFLLPGSVSQFIRHTFCPLPVRIHFRPVSRRELNRKRWNLIKTGHTKTQDKESVTSGKKFGQKCSQENEFSLNSKETERIVEFLIQYRLAPSVSKQFTPYLAESLEERGVTEAKPYTAIGRPLEWGP